MHDLLCLTLLVHSQLQMLAPMGHDAILMDPEPEHFYDLIIFCFSRTNSCWVSAKPFYN